MTSGIFSEGGFIRQVLSRFSVNFERRPIVSITSVYDFARTRSAFVSQKKLYGYLKARMGTRFPSMFEDEVFVLSINIAKMHVFAACLSDLTLHVVARGTAGAEVDPRELKELAVLCYESGLEANREAIPDADATEQEWLATFHERLEVIHWENLATHGDSFTESPKALYRWAPIADELKRFDREIVENSIRFAWADVIREFRRRADPHAIAADWKAVRAAARDAAERPA